MRYTQTLPLEAITFATRKHVGQFRKDKTPYIVHPMRVMSILSELFGVKDKEVLSAGVLHDTIEDTSASYQEIEEKFGQNVANYVQDLTKDDRLEKPKRNTDYARQLEGAPVQSRLCKLADIYDNISDTEALSLSKTRATVKKAENLFNKLIKGLPKRWTHAESIVRSKIEEKKVEIYMNEKMDEITPKDQPHSPPKKTPPEPQPDIEPPSDRPNKPVKEPPEPKQDPISTPGPVKKPIKDPPKDKPTNPTPKIPPRR